jgi:hypothetical protein
VQDQRVGRERPLLGWKRRGQLILHDDGILGFGDADPVRDPQHVAIDRQARNAERVTQHDVGRLPPDAGQVDQGVHARRHFARVALDEGVGHSGERLRLGPEEAGRLNLRLELVGRRPRQRACVRISLEESRRDPIDALVGALRRQNRRDEQLVRIAEVELGERARVLALELLEDLADPPARLHAG